MEKETRLLIQVLKKSMTLLRELIHIEYQKKEALYYMKAKNLISLNTKQEDILAMMAQTEEKRTELLKSISSFYAVKENTTLKEVIPLFPKEDQPYLIKFQKVLKTMVNRLYALKEVNEALLQSNMSVVDLILSQVDMDMSIYGENSSTTSSKHIISQIV